MAPLLPSSPDTSAADESDPRVIGVDSEAADDLLTALSSGTARELLGALHEDPAPPSKLADRIDTSLQNTQYHLEKLEDAGLVEVIDTAYSEKGREMNVYAPSDRPLVVVAGGEEETTSLRTALTSLLGGLGLLGIVSVLLQAVFGDGGLLGGVGGGAGGAPATTAAPTATETGNQVGILEATTTATQAAAGGAGLPPGVAFFAGGAAVLCLGFLVWYVRER